MSTLRRSALVALLLSAGAAAAQEAYTFSTWPQEVTRRPLTLGKGMIEAWVPLQANLSQDREWKPVYLNPSVAFGVTDRWTLKVRHFVGVCLGDAGDGCRHAYDDVSLESLFSLARTTGAEAALRLAGNWAPIHPSTWAGEAGLVLRGSAGRIALTLSPAVNFGLSRRDEGRKVTATPVNFGSYDVLVPTGAADNREFLLLPATAQIQLTPALAVAGAIALDGPLNPRTGAFGDFYTVPVSAAAVFSPARWLDVGAHFTWNNLVGKDHDTRDRQAGVFVALRR